MAAVSYPSLTSRQTQSSSAGSLSTVQHNQSMSTSWQSSVASNSQSLSAQPYNSQSSQLSQSQANTTSYQSTSSSQLSNRPSSQPSTPGKALPPRTDSPGAWRHPRAEEIARRQRASTFGPDQVSMIAKCAAALVVVQILRFKLPGFIWNVLSPITKTVGSWVLYAIYLAIGIMLVMALKPLYTGPDQLLDIDLNATQRSLLGLDPNATPPVTPATRYSTPPKYTKSVSRNGTPASRASSPSGSPLAYKDSGFRSDSFSSSRRASFGSEYRQSPGSVFGTPFKNSVFSPQTPSPITKASGITFSNKWLYHKGTAAMSRESF